MEAAADDQKTAVTVVATKVSASFRNSFPLVVGFSDSCADGRGVCVYVCG